MRVMGQLLNLSVQICPAEDMFARVSAKGQAPAWGLASPAGLRPPVKKDAPPSKVGPSPCTMTKGDTAKIALDTD